MDAWSAIFNYSNWQTLMVKVYARTNHPKLQKLRMHLDILKGNYKVERKADNYQIYLIYSEDGYGLANYAIEVQDNRDNVRRLTLIPGQDVRNTYWGHGKPVRYEHTYARSLAESASCKPTSRKTDLHNLGARIVKAFTPKGGKRNE